MKYDEIPWNDTIKKEARGIDDADFGEIQHVDPEYVITQKGIVDQEFFSFPIKLAQYYDGNAVIFKVTEEEARNSYIQSKNINSFSSKGIKLEKIVIDNIGNNNKSLSKTKEDEKEVIPLFSEELDVNKRIVEDEKIITKKPIKETKTVEVELKREEIESIERQPPSDESEGEAQEPIQSPEKIKIPLKKEEAQVTKKPYVKEEVVIKKKTVTDKKEITEDITTEGITSEELDTSDLDKKYKNIYNE
jgi:uncharacterized protein (TIGR02271 family)